MTTTTPRKKTKSFQASIRLEDNVVEFADRLAERLTVVQPHAGAFLISRAATLRLALLRGLDALAAEAGLPPLAAAGRATRRRSPRGGE